MNMAALVHGVQIVSPMETNANFLFPCISHRFQPAIAQPEDSNASPHSTVIGRDGQPILLACLDGKIIQTVHLLGIVTRSHEYKWHALFDVGEIYGDQAHRSGIHCTRI